ncbi:ribonuclease H-like domain-containing protein [Mycena latifolia]|nr:ribonuclease H-like domain-containing protein [Mycena latifolia]
MTGNRITKAIRTGFITVKKKLQITVRSPKKSAGKANEESTQVVTGVLANRPGNTETDGYDFVGTARKLEFDRREAGETISPAPKPAKNASQKSNNQKEGESDKKTLAALQVRYWHIIHGKESDKFKAFPYKAMPVRVESETHANEILRGITDGAVGFDTEYTDRRPTAEEQVIETRFPKGTTTRRQALLGWQLVEVSLHKIFPVAWDNISLRLVQIARGNDAWVLDMWKIRAFPTELRRILLSPDIKKVGVGLMSDMQVIWDDLRIDMNNLVDVGFMAKLALAEKYPKTTYGNLSLKVSVEEILGFELSKDLTTSGWKGTISEAQIKYAGLDALAALRLHEVLEEELARKIIRIEHDIPDGWYSFNSRAGDAFKIKPGYEGADIAWRTSGCTWYSGGRFIGYYP